MMVTLKDRVLLYLRTQVSKDLNVVLSGSDILLRTAVEGETAADCVACWFGQQM